MVESSESKLGKPERWTEAMVLNGGLEKLDLGDQHAVFDARTQTLVELNATALYIWDSISACARPSEIASALQRQGLSRKLAAAYVEKALSNWVQVGWTQPAALEHRLGVPAYAVFTLAILGIGFTVALHGSAMPDGLEALLATLYGRAPPHHRLAVVAWREGFFLIADDCSLGFFHPHEIVPAVKAAITERLASSLTEGFLAHGALLEGQRTRVFLSGPPGAGKSTLALALLEAGFLCLSDDIVHIDLLGCARGAPFAASLKEGAWSLVSHLSAMLDAAPVHQRADAKLVRYLPDVISTGLSQPINVFIALDRSETGEASLEPLSRLAAMQLLLKDSFAAAGRISGAQMTSLSRMFAGVDAKRLQFSRVSEAVAAVNLLIYV